MDKNYYAYPTSTSCFLLELYNNDYWYFFDFAAIHQHFGLIMTLLGPAGLNWLFLTYVHYIVLAALAEKSNKKKP